MQPNKYVRWARYYDRDPRNLYADDLPFYLNRAKARQGPVLELACGTGRVTIPLAQAGCAITGLDHSNAMLDVFRQKLGQLAPDILKGITLVQADMTDFTLPQQFPLIIVPFRSFQALTTKEAQRKCLACVKRHLSHAGEFILNVFRPQGVLDDGWVQGKQQDWVAEDPATGHRITRYSTRRAIDRQAQVLDIDIGFVVSSGAAIIEEFTDPLKLAYFYEPQLVDLVQQAGFSVVDRLGHYDGRDVSSGNEIILVCNHGDR